MTDPHPEIQALLDDFVDGHLEPGEARRVEEHLAACPACRDEVAGLRALIEDSRDLPREIAPSRDLWPGIASRLGGAAQPRLVPGATAWYRRPLFWVPVGGVLAAAAALTVALLALTEPKPTPQPTASLETAPADTAASPAPRAQWPALHRALEEECASTSKLVMAAYHSRDTTMDPALAQDIDRGLHTLDASIDETVQALEKDPDDPGLMGRLSGLYEKKLHLLKKTLRLAGVA